MRWMFPLCVLMIAVPAQAKWAFSADTGAAMVMPTGLEGNGNRWTQFGRQPRLSNGQLLRLDLGAVLVDSADIRPNGFQALRPAAKLFIFGGSLYGKTSLPITLSGDTKLGLLVGGGYGQTVRSARRIR